MLLSLPAGRHLVGWTGRDGEAFADSAGRFGDTLIEASRWNAETQQYDRYRSDAEDSANTLHELNRGDAMWLDLADDMRWWQSDDMRVGPLLRGDMFPRENGLT